MLIPIVMVPPSVRCAPRPIGRVLVPLDGTAEAAAAVAETATLLSGAGVELLILHVFVEQTVPDVLGPTGVRAARLVR